MRLRYILDVDPDQVELLEARLTLSGISFDRTDNLCALPWSNDETIFTGADVEWLPSAMNKFLKDRRDPNRVRECLEWLDDPGACWDFLILATMHCDWGPKPSRQQLHTMSATEWARFQEQYPEAVHPAGQEPGPIPLRPRLTNPWRPVADLPTMAGMLGEFLTGLEQVVREQNGLSPAVRARETVLTPREALVAMPVLRELLDTAHERTNLPGTIGEQARESARGYVDFLRNNISPEDQQQLEKLVLEKTAGETA